VVCVAVQEVRKKGVEPQWEGPGITKRDKGLVYVLDNFDCPDFKLLLGKCRIVGPAVVLAYLNKGWPLPASTQPIFSLAMRGVVACFTQTGARDKRERLSHLVLLMGGKVQKDYTRHVTHLIAGHVGSTKYNVARDLGMPVMLPSWVDHCWTAGLDSHISALDPDILKAHRCPPFTGCTVTVTGLEERERRKVRQAVEANGGVYSGELTKDVCTHLLVGSTTSAKYKFAQQWQIFCVSSQWLYDSAERGYCLSEANYSVGDRGGGGEGEKKVADKGKLSVLASLQ
jgi:topoisomerase (DNA) II binding protein 1